MTDIQVRLSNLAIQDMVGIEDYTARTWGDGQADAYLHQLQSRFYWLAEHAGGGTFRGEIAQGLYSFPEGRHVIFYRSKDSILEVARVLHQSMDIEHQFD